MRRPYLIITGVALASFFLQNSLVNLNWQVDILVSIVIAAALLQPKFLLVFSTVLGLLADILYSGYGVYALTLLLLTLIISFFNDHFAWANKLAVFFSIIAGLILALLIAWLFNWSFSLLFNSSLTFKFLNFNWHAWMAYLISNTLIIFIFLKIGKKFIKDNGTL